MSLTSYASTRILNYNFGGTAYPLGLPSSYFFGLSTTTGEPDFITPVLVEPTGVGSYARKEFVNNKPNWKDALTTGILTNNVAIEFVASTADWGTIYKVGMWDALTGGNLWWWDSLSPSRAVPSLTTVILSADSVSIRFNNTA